MPTENQINLIENNCVLLLISCTNTVMDFDSVLYAQNHVKLNVIKLTVIWFHCQRYGAMSEPVIQSVSSASQPANERTHKSLHISFEMRCLLWNLCDKQSSGCSSLTQIIYDHIMNIDQLIVTTSVYRFKFPAIQPVKSCILHQRFDSIEFIVMSPNSIEFRSMHTRAPFVL